MRLLTPRDRLLFAESDRTRTAMREDGLGRTLLTTFGPFRDVYGGERRYRETDALRLYHCVLSEDERRELTTDAAILRVIDAYANERDVTVNTDLAASVAAELGFDVAQVHGGCSPHLQPSPRS